MYRHSLHQQIRNILADGDSAESRQPDASFVTRLTANATALDALFHELYGNHPQRDQFFSEMVRTLIRAHVSRPVSMLERDDRKLDAGHWFLSNQITGMSLYVDRFCSDLNGMRDRLTYIRELGVNLLHLMPLFESPEGESDGGYAVSDFRRVDPKFGTIEDLRSLQELMQSQGMYLMLDIVFNHTSHHHEWARRAKAGDPEYQDFFYMFPDRTLPDRYDAAMPEIFPESAPGNFTWVEECGKWVMTVFHRYQWDLNYRNPRVFIEMLDTVLFHANLGIDILRIDAPAFIWKEPGTTCQNLPGAHTLLRLLRQCVATSAPGMALLGEAIVAPADIMRYFGTGIYTARECDIAYNATHMALQWDALATGDTRIMLSAQPQLQQKPFGTTWINYVRCHDDIGLGYTDEMIREAGFDPYAHRRFIKDHYSGVHPGSEARGALFSVNPKTQDARISGSLASLCGLETAISADDRAAVDTALDRILMMQAHSLFLGGIPMLFYGDEIASLNDYTYQEDPGKYYDNRWMHRPRIDWQALAERLRPGTPMQCVFTGLQRLIRLRREYELTGDYGNISWMHPHNIHVAGYVRTLDARRLYCVFNFGKEPAWLTWYAFKQHGILPDALTDLWSGMEFRVGPDHEHFILPPYGFALLINCD
ncbi:MAG: alpha-amylase family glycosyl hydrolase [Chitinophagaceae bacterium]